MWFVTLVMYPDDITSCLVATCHLVPLCVSVVKDAEVGQCDMMG